MFPLTPLHVPRPSSFFSTDRSSHSSTHQPELEPDLPAPEATLQPLLIQPETNQWLRSQRAPSFLAGAAAPASPTSSAPMAPEPNVRTSSSSTTTSPRLTCWTPPPLRQSSPEQAPPGRPRLPFSLSRCSLSPVPHLAVSLSSGRTGASPWPPDGAPPRMASSPAGTSRPRCGSA